MRGAVLLILLSQVLGLDQSWIPGARRADGSNAAPAVLEPIYPVASDPSLLSVGERTNAMFHTQDIPAFGLPSVAGYIPESTPFDNPSTSYTPTPTIPNTPECAVRPQTVVEIQRMRESASKIAQMMQEETIVMNKRKSYVEQMTNYLNDRIRELNKVKAELSQELRWLELSSNRIAELEQREKLVKLQDVKICLTDLGTRSTTDASAVATQLANINTQTTAVNTQISTIKSKISSIQGGGATGGGGSSSSSSGT